VDPLIHVGIFSETRIGFLLAGLILTLAGLAALSQSQINYFEKSVRQCHSARDGKFKGGLALDTRAGVTTGGD